MTHHLVRNGISISLWTRKVKHQATQLLSICLRSHLFPILISGYGPSLVDVVIRCRCRCCCFRRFSRGLVFSFSWFLLFLLLSFRVLFLLVVAVIVLDLYWFCFPCFRRRCFRRLRRFWDCCCFRIGYRCRYLRAESFGFAVLDSLFLDFGYIESKFLLEFFFLHN